MSDGNNGLNVEIAEQPGQLSFVELIYGVLFIPTNTFRRVAQNPPLTYAVIIFFSISVLTTLAGTLVHPQVPGIAAEYTGAIRQARPFLVVVGVIFAALFWLINAGVFGLTAELLGGRAGSVSVLVVLALSGIPGIFIVPVEVVNYFAGESFFSNFLSVAGTLAVFFWSLILLVVGLREAAGFSTWRALATLLIPAGLLILMLILLVVSFFGIAAPFVMNYF